MWMHDYIRLWCTHLSSESNNQKNDLFEICVLWENKAILGLFMPYAQLEVLASKQLESQLKKSWILAKAWGLLTAGFRLLQCDFPFQKQGTFFAFKRYKYKPSETLYSLRGSFQPY